MIGRDRAAVTAGCFGRGRSDRPAGSPRLPSM